MKLTKRLRHKPMRFAHLFIPFPFGGFIPFAWRMHKHSIKGSCFNNPDFQIAKADKIGIFCRRESYSQGKICKIEDKLPDILAYLEIYASRAIEQRKEDERKRKIEEEEKRR